MIEPVSGSNDPKLLRAVLQGVVGDQSFRNCKLVEDVFEMIDDSARGDVSQCS